MEKKLNRCQDRNAHWNNILIWGECHKCGKELSRTPEMDAKVKEAIESLLTPAFGRYLSNITVVAPKPTTFNVELINSLDFQLIYSRGGFFAKISGKKYDLAMGNAVDRACSALSNLLSLSPALKEDISPEAASADSVSGAEAPKPDAGEEAFKDLSGAGTPPPETAAPETPAETPPTPA